MSDGPWRLFSKNRVAAKCLIALLTVLASAQVLDLFGAGRLRRFDEQANRLVGQQRNRIADHRRAVVVGDIVDQNAAVWYQLAFAKLKTVPPAVRTDLRDAVDADAVMDPVWLRLRVEEACRELSSVHVARALRCRFCDWGVAYRLEDAGDWQHTHEALILGYCEILNGQLLARNHDASGAVHSYVDALAFGSDLAQGDFAMNLMGILFWKLGLRQLDKLVDSPAADQSLLNSIGESLSKVEGGLPSVRMGLRFETLWLATGLANNAHAYVDSRTVGLSRTLPWRAIAAWRVSRDAALIEQLDRAATVSDSKQRSDIAIDLKRRLRDRSTSLLRDEIPIDSWVRFASEADSVSASFAGLRIAVRLETWHAAHSEYPSKIEMLSPPVDLHGLTYERTDTGAGYRLIARLGGANVVVRQSFTSRPR